MPRGRGKGCAKHARTNCLECKAHLYRPKHQPKTRLTTGSSPKPKTQPNPET